MRMCLALLVEPERHLGIGSDPKVVVHHEASAAVEDDLLLVIIFVLLVIIFVLLVVFAFAFAHLLPLIVIADHRFGRFRLALRLASIGLLGLLGLLSGVRLRLRLLAADAHVGAAASRSGLLAKDTRPSSAQLFLAIIVIGAGSDCALGRGSSSGSSHHTTGRGGALLGAALEGKTGATRVRPVGSGHLGQLGLGERIDAYQPAIHRDEAGVVDVAQDGRKWLVPVTGTPLEGAREVVAGAEGKHADGRIVLLGQHTVQLAEQPAGCAVTTTGQHAKALCTVGFQETCQTGAGTSVSQIKHLILAQKSHQFAEQLDTLVSTATSIDEGNQRTLCMFVLFVLFSTGFLA
mmetsp:Transcript_11029/g.33768  ORF Transcript_11029/g.33768 Transcript_11029/m.33768 type:complete len:348 (+) Transcript_11029:1321-2364(+)